MYKRLFTGHVSLTTICGGFALIVAHVLAHYIVAPLFDRRIVSGGWSLVVLSQLMLQAAVAGLANWAGRGRGDQREVQLFLFGLSLGTLALLWDLPIAWATGGLAGLAKEMDGSLLALIACGADDLNCAPVLGPLVTGALAVALASCVGAAWTLRVDPNVDRSEHTNGFVFLLAVSTYTAAALLVNEWSGVIEAIDPKLEERAAPIIILRSIGDEGRAFLIVVSIVVIAALQALAAVPILFVSVKLGLADAVRAAPKWAFLFVKDAIAIMLVLTAILGVALAIAHASWNLIEYFALALTMLAAAAWSAGTSGLGLLLTDNFERVADTPVVDSGTTNLDVWLVLQVLLVAALILAGTALRHSIVRGVKVLVVMAKRNGPVLLTELVGLLKRWRMKLLHVATVILLGPPVVEAALQPTPHILKPVIAAQRFTLLSADLVCGAEAYDSVTWAFDSADYFALRASGCTIDTDIAPTVIVVVGTASADDTDEGGFDLSVRRATTMAQLAEEQFPEAVVVMAALGRQVSDMRFARTPDALGSGRPPLLFYSAEIIPQPLAREPLLATISNQLRFSGMLDRYQTCWLAEARYRTLPARLPYPLARTGCRWGPTREPNAVER